MFLLFKIIVVNEKCIHLYSSHDKIHNWIQIKGADLIEVANLSKFFCHRILG